MNDDADRLPILLFDLFQNLVNKGVPIGIRDFLDGLHALQLGFGQGNRNDLSNLAQVLWARSDEERRLIAHWFVAIPEPEQKLFESMDQKLDEIEHKISQNYSAEKHPDTLRETSPDVTNYGDITQRQTNASTVRMSFSNTRESESLILPRLHALPTIHEKYALFPQTLVSPRDMIVLWRRYRRTTRSGPQTELDVIGTVRERCRRGLLLHPVYRARRNNSVRLLILADASPSMTPWLPFLATLGSSLLFGRFASAEIHYFINLPRKQLYTSQDLSNPESQENVLRRFVGASLLVVSDGGSVRGYLNRRRAAQTSKFLSEVSGLFRTIVWLNPMPYTRWTNTTAALIAKDSRATFLSLEPGQLLRTIDILRGNKA